MSAMGNPLTELLRPHVADLKAAAEAGDTQAEQVIKLYQMYVACPGDAAAPALCEEVFKGWLAGRAKAGAPA